MIRPQSSRLNTTPPQFYIKGSFVLDVIFDRCCAKDIDFFYDSSCQPLTQPVARDWLKKLGFPHNKPLDLTPVDNIEDASGGGFPEFNIDRWHIRHDGKLYTLEETATPHEDGGLGGRPLNKTKPVELQKSQAKQERLQILPPGHYHPSGDAGLERVKKALRKMSDHRELLNEELRSMLEAMRDTLARGEEINAPADSDDGGDDLEIEF